jgi:hypothetical protein
VSQENHSNPSKINLFQPLAPLADKLQSLLVPALCEARLGCHLNTLLGYTSVMPITAPKKKRSLLPVLTVLFVLSYGLMTMLIVEQGAAIQSQRNTIKVLLRDSTELWAAKGKAIGDQQMARAQAQSSAETPSSQTPSTQAPSTQAPSTQTPSNQTAPRQHSQNRADKIAKPGSEHPPIPAADLVDQRRSLRTI